MGALEPLADLDRLVGDAVAVAVREADDPVGAAFRDDQRAVRSHGHEPRRREPFGEDRRRIALRDDELGAAARPEILADPDGLFDRPTKDDDGAHRDDDREEREH